MNIPFFAPFAERLWLRRNRNLRAAALVCAVLLAVNLALFLAAVRPLSADLRERESRNADLRKRHAVAVQFQQQKKSFGGVMAGLPTQKDMPLLVKDLVQTARGFNLRVGSVNYEIPRSGGEGITMLSFSFPVEGGYADLKRFIYEVETSRRLAGIEALEMKAGRGVVALDLKLITYVRGQ